MSDLKELLKREAALRTALTDVGNEILDAFAAAVADEFGLRPGVRVRQTSGGELHVYAGLDGRPFMGPDGTFQGKPCIKARPIRKDGQPAATLRSLLASWELAPAEEQLNA